MTATTDTPGRFGSNEAAQGARNATLAAIDLFYAKYRADLDAELTAALAASASASINTIRALAIGVEVTDDGHLIGWDLRRRMVARKLADHLLDVVEQRAQIGMRYQVALSAADEAHLEARRPYDFTVSPPSVHRNQAAS